MRLGGARGAPAFDIAFGLRLRKVDNGQIGRRVGQMLELVDLPNVAARYPAQQFRGRQAIETFFLSPLLVPHILLGAALYLYLARLAWPTSSSTLLAGHIVIATPYVIRCVTAGLVGMDPRLEEAAMSLGASRLQAFFKVTLPLLRSSLVTGAVFAFIISFSDINLALFLAGASAPSLPVHIFSQIQFEADPSIAAASACRS